MSICQGTDDLILRPEEVKAHQHGEYSRVAMEPASDGRGLACLLLHTVKIVDMYKRLHSEGAAGLKRATSLRTMCERKESGEECHNHEAADKEKGGQVRLVMREKYFATAQEEALKRVNAEAGYASLFV